MANTPSGFVTFAADRLRATRVDRCGKPIVGPKSTLVTNAVISVKLAADVEEAPVIEVKNAQQQLVARKVGQPTTKGYKVTLTLTGMNPEFMEMTTSQKLVTNGNGDAVGLRISEQPISLNGFALEAWADAQGEWSDDCLGGSAMFAYYLLPMLSGGRMGDIELNDGALSCVIEAQSQRSSGWGIGPYDIADSGTDPATPVPGPLADEWKLTDVLHNEYTPIAPPTVTGGAIALAIP